MHHKSAEKRLSLRMYRNFIKNNLEIIFFITLLLSLSVIIWYSKFYIITGLQNIITLYAVIIALGTVILATVTNKRIINEMKIAREEEISPYIVCYFEFVEFKEEHITMLH
jgi:ABC-type uncharacterized transport system fused permease/ATPase subunit